MYLHNVQNYLQYNVQYYIKCTHNVQYLSKNILHNLFGI